nr:DUF5615 family PIN-like protein [Microbacterium bovistercoris]
MTERLLLDEHYSQAIAAALRVRGHDVVAVVTDPDLRGADDPAIFRSAAQSGRRIVTENIKDFRPLLLAALDAGDLAAALLLVPPRRFPRGSASRTGAIIGAIEAWMSPAGDGDRPVEDWLV